MNILRKHRHLESEVPTASLNDILFFLLLFFLLISTFANPTAIKILLPSARSKQHVDAKPINLSVTVDGRYFINDKPIDFANLENELMRLCKTNSQSFVVLRLPASSSIQQLTDILQIGVRQRIKMTIAVNNSVQYFR